MEINNSNVLKVLLDVFSKDGLRATRFTKVTTDDPEKFTFTVDELHFTEENCEFIAGALVKAFKGETPEEVQARADIITPHEVAGVIHYRTFVEMEYQINTFLKKKGNTVGMLVFNTSITEELIETLGRNVKERYKTMLRHGSGRYAENYVAEDKTFITTQIMRDLGDYLKGDEGYFLLYNKKAFNYD